MPVWFRFALFLLIAAGIVIALSRYVTSRAARTFRLSPAARRALGITLMLAPLLAIGGRLLERPLGSVAQGIAMLGFVLVMATLLASALLGVLHLAELGWRHARRLREPTPAPAMETAPVTETSSPAPATETAVPAVEASARSEPSVLVSPERRVFLQQATVGAALVAGFGGASHGALFGRRDYVVEEVVVPIVGLSPKLSGYRIAQLSDIHFGQFVGEPERRSAVELVRRARPDLIVMTGDLVDISARHAPELGRLTRALAELGARDGVVVVPGNHDYYTGIEAVLGAVHGGGARTLVNQGLVLGGSDTGFALLGVDDVWARRQKLGVGPDLNRALSDVPRDLPRILLCHNPEFFPHAAGKVALQLSGHTHGGQINPGLHPAKLVLPYVQGLYHEHGSALYVNRGFGTAGPPIRIGAPPEVTLVVLTAA